MLDETKNDSGDHWGAALAEQAAAAKSVATVEPQPAPIFEKLHAEGNTIIVVTHEPDIAARAHRVISIRDGMIEKDERLK